MRSLRLLIALMTVSVSASVFAQQTPPPDKPARAKAAAPAATSKTSNKPAASDPALPPKEVVESFMKRMFGYSPSAKWKVLDIAPSEIPGIAQVLVTIGGQPQPNQLFVMPGGKFAMVGEVIPFGADPFAPVRNRLNAETRGVRRGTENAPVTLVEFSDLQCPHCKAAQPIIDRLIAESPNAKLIFQPFPLPMHNWAAKAAYYADCVAQQNPDAFWKFITSVYDAQAEITEPDADKKLTDLATAAGVDGANAAACAAKPESFAHVQKSIDLGREVGVTATPTLFINGRKVQGLKETPFEQLKAMVDFEATQTAKK